jgi:phage gpG-like protein
MQLIVTDTATAALQALAAKVTNPQPIARAAGEAVAQLARRSFTDESVRAAPWAPLAPSTLAQKLAGGTMTQILRRSGLLWLSWRVTAVNRNSVTVGSDRRVEDAAASLASRSAGGGGVNLSLAAIHQWGTADGRIPARPMLPLTGGPDNPQFTALAVRDMLAAARGVIGL